MDEKLLTVIDLAKKLSDAIHVCPTVESVNLFRPTGNCTIELMKPLTTPGGEIEDDGIWYSDTRNINGVTVVYHGKKIEGV